MTNRINITPLPLADAMDFTSTTGVDIASACDVTPSAVSKWRADGGYPRHVPSTVQFEAMCSLMGLVDNDRKRLTRWFTERYEAAVST